MTDAVRAPAIVRIDQVNVCRVNMTSAGLRTVRKLSIADTDRKSFHHA